MELKKNYFSPMYFNQKRGEPLVDVAVPLQAVMSGKIQYVLLASIRLKKIWDLLADISSRNQIVFILDKAGNIIGHPDPSVVLSGQKYRLPPITSGIAEGLSGNQVVMAVKQLDFGNQSIYIVAQQEVA
ncbi:MAG: cache domain-containing protein, partial [Desulfobulbaceae bacterium]|nr:cache domain-containing protein [Desulfobulbaceae bacterium]